VCLSNGYDVLAEITSLKDYSHTEKITIYIQDVLKEAGAKLNDIDAIVVSCGPGSYTGLRVGVTVAKSICYALDKPLIAISSLESLIYGAENIAKGEIYLSTIDARRQEVYAAYYDFDRKSLKPVHSLILTETDANVFENHEKILVLGDGSTKTVDYYNDDKFINGNVNPKASNLIIPAIELYSEQIFEDVFTFEPKYYKSPNITKSKKYN
jgi:tRNA threonylcarbamoyladenosine biosynthesis protein TsaB